MGNTKYEFLPGLHTLNVTACNKSPNVHQERGHKSCQYSTMFNNAQSYEGGVSMFSYRK